ncbi:M56 family metallopeptidase [Pseudofrankia inefficax]|uniref:Peptidase M48 Ste24p n=1 Tax=Pseudofrankia inefficax (strain DSM 45817 / CECT 9037 / DDB 130130 / EuI1c) TaxID=298654 RepID=E3JCW4_PSEI1|nr:M56 family metallopeptidase [Pseudofrankia inefficax]ADP79954.1 peptidase M48 Ste24p [Pseudofrankia inefficax]
MVRELVLCALVAPLLGTLVMRLLADRVAAGVAVVAFTVSACLLAVATALVLFASGIHTTTAIVKTGKRGWTTEAWADAGRDAWLSGPFAIVAIVAAVSAIRAFHRQRAAVRAAGDEAAALPGEDLVVMVPGTQPDAFTLPGSRGRIVVTEALRDALSADELSVVLAHERAHLDCHHHRYVDAARLAAAGQPLLRPVARLVEYGVERWADERAALEIGDRALVARTIGAVALATAAAGPARSTSGARSSGARSSGKPNRTRRLPARAAAATPGTPRCPAHQSGHHPVEPHALRITSPAWLTERPRRYPSRWRTPYARLRPAAQPGPVPRRVSALLRPLPSSSHRMLVTIPAILSLSSCLWAGNIVYDVHTPLRVALTVEDQFGP